MHDVQCRFKQVLIVAVLQRAWLLPHGAFGMPAFVQPADQAARRDRDERKGNGRKQGIGLVKQEQRDAGHGDACGNEQRASHVQGARCEHEGDGEGGEQHGSERNAGSIDDNAHNQCDNVGHAAQYRSFCRIQSASQFPPVLEHMSEQARVMCA